ncbi:PREDICTED: uncharacterized protein LOC108782467 [Cyphomyrmex costatus]|uniref:uncharacterized protein LOC108782467 n=1 Tax=Cyphomyrmex costatus TaxID=456900 RepID=UPI0008523986|nr:PREDICTED: uncharacterized protein LOC108782467 [Cyphomyrmex costatus]
MEQETLRSSEEKQCEEHFGSTFSREEDGRFVLHLPVKNSIEELEDSYKGAEKRLRALERRLEKQPVLKEHYHEFLKEYIQLGHMTEIQSSNIHTDGAYYIPHHAAIKEESTTTKTRVVFDASFKTTSGKSLNDLLLVGPIIQENPKAFIIN